MELIRGLHNLRPEHHGCVATIGNFDGVHLGHQAVLGQVAENAARLGLPCVVITFEPHPQEFFDADTAPPRLTRLREKLLMFSRFSVDKVLCLRFNSALCSMQADDFIQKLLVDGLGVRYLVVGDDFRFGYKRTGNIETLRRASKQHNFQVVNMHTFIVDNERVSSTRIRNALQNNKLSAAAKLLGRTYRMAGKVVHGDKRGRTIGVPTANIYLHRLVTPLSGVYAVEVYGLDKEPLQGMANVGVRPTVGGRICLLEVHLFDFDQDIYGRQVQVEFHHWLRPEMTFDSLDELKAQIKTDLTNGRAWFARR